MPPLLILRYPDPRLHEVAELVPAVNGEIQQLVKDMAATMYAAPGIGLAATQVGVLRQVIVIDISDTHDELQVFINPRILKSVGSAECEEGCLSVPGVYEKVTRAEWIEVQALNAQGELFTLQTSGLLAVCIQHEIDHLSGKVFVEYLSQLKQRRILAKLKKQLRAM